jgi:hypothetical protein
MLVKVRREEGYDLALEGLSYSFDAPIENMPKRAKLIAHKGAGENKFLEQIAVWIEVTAPRKWWSHADTYRIGVSKQSQSTMHTALKRHLRQEDFNRPIPDAELVYLNSLIDQRDLEELKDQLPEGFIQKRMVFTNYKTLQAMYVQRHNHKLKEWHEFLAEIVAQLQHPYFIVKA